MFGHMVIYHLWVVEPNYVTCCCIWPLLFLRKGLTNLMSFPVKVHSKSTLDISVSLLVTLVLLAWWPCILCLRMTSPDIAIFLCCSVTLEGRLSILIPMNLCNGVYNVKLICQFVPSLLRRYSSSRYTIHIVICVAYCIVYFGPWCYHSLSNAMHGVLCVCRNQLLAASAAAVQSHPPHLLS